MAPNENVDNLNSAGKNLLDTKATNPTDNVHPQPTASLTGEEKKVFDAAFVGIIIGAGLTALLFACM